MKTQNDVGKHKDVFEYDGAFKCISCQKSWGALPGNPVQPEECKLSPTDRRILKLEKQRRSIDSELNYLHYEKKYVRS
jgi:hypothetical protein